MFLRTVLVPLVVQNAGWSGGGAKLDFGALYAGGPMIRAETRSIDPRHLELFASRDSEKDAEAFWEYLVYWYRDGDDEVWLAHWGGFAFPPKPGERPDDVLSFDNSVFRGVTESAHSPGCSSRWATSTVRTGPTLNEFEHTGRAGGAAEPNQPIGEHWLRPEATTGLGM